MKHSTQYKGHFHNTKLPKFPRFLKFKGYLWLRNEKSNVEEIIGQRIFPNWLYFTSKLQYFQEGAIGQHQL